MSCVEAPRSGAGLGGRVSTRESCLWSFCTLGAHKVRELRA